MNKVKTEVKHIFGRDQTDVSSGSTSHPDSPTRLTGGTAGNGPTDGRSSMSTEAERIAGRGNPLSGSYGTRYVTT